jgi:hypothetical protein
VEINYDYLTRFAGKKYHPVRTVIVGTIPDRKIVTVTVLISLVAPYWTMAEVISKNHNTGGIKINMICHFL